MLAAVEIFYIDVVQHIKPWSPAPPKVKEGEPALTDEPVPGEASGQSLDDIHPVSDSPYVETLRNRGFPRVRILLVTPGCPDLKLTHHTDGNKRRYAAVEDVHLKRGDE